MVGLWGGAPVPDQYVFARSFMTTATVEPVSGWSVKDEHPRFYRRKVESSFTGHEQRAEKMVIGAYQGFTGTGIIAPPGVEVPGAAGLLYRATVSAVHTATGTATYLPRALWAAPQIARAIADAAELTNAYLAECDSRHPVTTRWP